MDMGKLDFGSLFGGSLNNASKNASTNKTFHDGMMESLLPIVGGQFSPVLRSVMFIYQMLGNHLGIDPTLILTLAGFIWAINRVGRQVYSTIYGIMQTNFMSTVHVSSTDDIYDQLMKWLAKQPRLVNSRSLMAETMSKTAWEEEEDLQLVHTTTTSEGAVYLNFSNHKAKAVSVLFV